MEYLSNKKRAIWFRQALMIGFLISRPVRRRAVLAMEAEGYLTDLPDAISVTFESKDMKDGKDRSFPLPKALVEPMRNYLGVHRPLLLAGGTSVDLWINQYGDPITPDGFSRELPKIMERHLGIAMRPHAFRSVAATSIAEFDPVHVNIIRDVLGHATLDMAEKHYNRASSLSACNDLQSLVQNIRKSRRKKRRPPMRSAGLVARSTR
ncbi:tyrosine-type recombinase/integrase [Aliiroseovarius sp.]|uniref:tyrosine-type recombinase/integrase n=1 Tax=Aliiroseovarius sp. TaxID=1872442 RepID=UPI002609D5DF|nr:tyrosine-type recombinase/integrase [Aliiroseovarius sp.]